MTVRIGIVGTFDVLNFGDLLFPLLAYHELTERLGAIELIRYSYRRMSAPEWPYDVRSLRDFISELDSLDLLVVGGGDLIRFDTHVAPGYLPTDSGLHHPTAYWLMPTILASSRGVPIAWNAVGVVRGMPSWAHNIVELALEHVGYISVRDHVSAARLKGFGASERVLVTPDTAFGVRKLLQSGAAGAAFQAFAKEKGIKSPYVIVQPSPHLASRARRLRGALEQIGPDQYRVLEVPISPALGDRCGLLGIKDAVDGDGLITDPVLLAEVVTRADAVVAQSLHLSIVSLAGGVPVNRFAASGGSKYRALEGLSGVRLLDRSSNGDGGRLLVGRRPPGAQAIECAAQVAAHWDRIAGLVGRRACNGNAVAARLYDEYMDLLSRSLTSSPARKFRRALSRGRLALYRLVGAGFES